VPARLELLDEAGANLRLVIVRTALAEMLDHDLVDHAERAAGRREIEPVDLDAPSHAALLWKRQHTVAAVRADRDERPGFDERRGAHPREADGGGDPVAPLGSPRARRLSEVEASPGTRLDERNDVPAPEHEVVVRDDRPRGGLAGSAKRLVQERELEPRPLADGELGKGALAAVETPPRRPPTRGGGGLDEPENVVRVAPAVDADDQTRTGLTFSL